MSEYLVPFADAESEFVEKRSRFIGQIKRVESEEEARAFIESIKKKHYGSFIMNFNDIDSIANDLVGEYFSGCGLFERLSVLESITAEDIDARLRNAINIENSSMSVIM